MNFSELHCVLPETGYKFSLNLVENWNVDMLINVDKRR